MRLCTQRCLSVCGGIPTDKKNVVSIWLWKGISKIKGRINIWKGAVQHVNCKNCKEMMLGAWKLFGGLCIVIEVSRKENEQLD